MVVLSSESPIFTNQSTLIFNGLIHKVDSNRLRNLVDEDVVEATVDLSQGQAIGEGAYSKVLRCPMVCLSASGQRKTIQIAIKIVLDFYATQMCLKEGLIGEIASKVSNVAAGVFLIKQTTFYLFERLYKFDAHYYSYYLTIMNTKLTQEKTVGFLADVLKGASELEELRIFHIDLKPSNIFLDQFDRMYLGDLGGALNFPSFDELTPEFLRRQLFIYSEDTSPNAKKFMTDIFSKIDRLSVCQKIFIVIYCQTLSFVCPSTKNTSSLVLQKKIDEYFKFFLDQFNNQTCSDYDLIQKYEELPLLLSSLMVFQSAATFLCSLDQVFYEDINAHRNSGVYTKAGDPFCIGRIKQVTNNVQVSDQRIPQLLFQMFQAETEYTTSAKIYAQLLEIKKTL